MYISFIESNPEAEENCRKQTNTHKHKKTINTLEKTMKSDSGRKHVRRMIGIFKLISPSST